jgi:hypothetical protein
MSAVTRLKPNTTVPGAAADWTLASSTLSCRAAAELLSQREQQRTSMRLGLPSKGRMAEDTQELLKVNAHERTGCRHVENEDIEVDISTRQWVLHACNGIYRHPGLWDGTTEKGRRAAWALMPGHCCMQDCQLAVYKPNPRQYVATISQVSDVPPTHFAAGW